MECVCVLCFLKTFAKRASAQTTPVASEKTELSEHMQVGEGSETLVVAVLILFVLDSSKYRPMGFECGINIFVLHISFSKRSSERHFAMILTALSHLPQGS